MSSLCPFVGEIVGERGDGFSSHVETVIVHAIGVESMTVERADGVICVWRLSRRSQVRRLPTPVSEFERVPYVPCGWKDEPPKAPPIPTKRCPG